MILEEITNKKTELTADEFEKIKEHTIAGADYLKKINKDKNKNEYLEMAIDELIPYRSASSAIVFTIL